MHLDGLVDGQPVPIAKWKQPQPLEWIKRDRARWSFPNWQSGNDDSVYYNMHIRSGWDAVS